MKNLFVITGAARGFGRSIALSVAKHFQNCDFLLISRDETKLAQVTKEIQQIAPSSYISVLLVDLGDVNVIENAVADAFLKLSNGSYSKAFLVNNAGSLGPMALVSEMSLGQIRTTVDLNVTSFLLLTATFLQVFKSIKEIFLVNISSLCAVKPFAAFSIYCSGKAARDMYFSCIAEEAKENTSQLVKTLNYAPGPLRTDMQVEIRNECTFEPARKPFVEMNEKGSLVECDVSADKLTNLLLQNSFVSGSHVDFYDI